MDDDAAVDSELVAFLIEHVAVAERTLIRLIDRQTTQVPAARGRRRRTSGSFAIVCTHRESLQTIATDDRATAVVRPTAPAGVQPD